MAPLDIVYYDFILLNIYYKILKLILFILISTVLNLISFKSFSKGFKKC